MLKLKVTLRTLAAAGGIAAVALAGLPALALASPRAAAPSVTGPEVISGAIHGKAALANAPVIPLKLTGLLVTSSKVNLGGSGSPHKGATKTLKTPEGNLTVMVTAKPQSTQSLNPKTCAESYAQYIVVSVDGAKSTGSFAGASGPGAVQIAFHAIAPRFKSGSHKGQCNPNGQPGAKGAVATFLASVVLTTK
jgi:hypothetical protein